MTTRTVRQTSGAVVLRAPAVTFVAQYEDAEKCETAVRTNGWDENESLVTVVEREGDAVRTTREFTTLEPAIDWLTAEIDAFKTVFGVGVVREVHLTRKRCSACVCRGSLAVHRWIVSDGGIEQDDALDSPCYWGDER